MSRRRAAGLAVGLILACSCATSSRARPAPEGDPTIAAAVAEASAAFGLPERWIEAVMAAESGRDPRAVSRAGALGLMQLMPGTWAALRARLDLGADPFDVRDNVMAGAAYLREMFDRFGAPGFLAAYNAGLTRFAAGLTSGRALPAETRTYVARLASQIVGSGARAAADTGPPASSPLVPHAGDLFVSSQSWILPR